MVFSRDRRSIDGAQWWASLRTGGNRGTAVPCCRPVFRAAATANSVWRTMALSEVLQTSLWASTATEVALPDKGLAMRCGPKVPFFPCATQTRFYFYSNPMDRKSTWADRSLKRKERAAPSSLRSWPSKTQHVTLTNIIQRHPPELRRDRKTRMRVGFGISQVVKKSERSTKPEHNSLQAHFGWNTIKPKAKKHKECSMNKDCKMFIFTELLRDPHCVQTIPPCIPHVLSI